MSDRFDAQARELFPEHVTCTPSCTYIARTATALRAAESSALERAAQSFRANTVSQFSGKEVASILRVLIPPAAAPAADPIHEAYLAADEYGQPPAPAAETGKAHGAEARKWFWVRAEHPRGAAEEPIFHLSDGGALMHCGDYVTGRVVRETPRRDRQCLRCRAYELLAARVAPPDREGT